MRRKQNSKYAARLVVGALTFERLTPQLIDSTRRKLDCLLATEGAQSRHAWLRSRPTSVSAAALRRELDKRAFLIGELGADRFDLSALPPNRRAWFRVADLSLDPRRGRGLELCKPDGCAGSELRRQRHERPPQRVRENVAFGLKVRQAAEARDPRPSGRAAGAGRP